MASTPEEDGTAIGDALTLAVSRLTETEAESRVIILLTDGSNNAGKRLPQVAASKLKAKESPFTLLVLVPMGWRRFD